MIGVCETVSISVILKYVNLFKAFHLTGGLQLENKLSHTQVCLEGGEGWSLSSLNPQL